jgi:hypothetical protein
MNQRIRELAGKALDEAVPETWTTLDYDEIQKLQEYFAELIVRECSRIADGWVDNDDDGKNYPSEMIKQHFGVER